MNRRDWDESAVRVATTGKTVANAMSGNSVAWIAIPFGTTGWRDWPAISTQKAEHEPRHLVMARAVDLILSQPKPESELL